MYNIRFSAIAVHVAEHPCAIWHSGVSGCLYAYPPLPLASACLLSSSIGWNGIHRIDFTQGTPAVRVVHHQAKRGLLHGTRYDLKSESRWSYLTLSRFDLPNAPLCPPPYQVVHQEWDTLDRPHMCYSLGGPLSTGPLPCHFWSTTRETECPNIKPLRKSKYENYQKMFFPKMKKFLLMVNKYEIAHFEVTSEILRQWNDFK